MHLINENNYNWLILQNGNIPVAIVTEDEKNVLRSVAVTTQDGSVVMGLSFDSPVVAGCMVHSGKAMILIKQLLVHTRNIKTSAHPDDEQEHTRLRDDTLVKLESVVYDVENWR